MRKNLLIAMSAIAMLFATSCQDDFDNRVDFGETSTVSFTVSTPDMATRAYSDGTTATVLQYAVYDAAGNELEDLTVTNGKIEGSASVELQLTTGNTYSVIFWAAAQGAPYEVNFANKTMTVDYTAPVCNDENRDAFYKYHTFTVNGAQTETIELKRPFAQLNIGTADYEASKDAGYVPTKSAVTVKNVYSTLNLASGEVSDDAEVAFAKADIKKDETFPVSGYEYIAMNYLLVSKDKETVDIEFAYAESETATPKTRTVGSVPVQRNYRTNIYGNLLTSEVDINVEIKPEYETPDNLVYVWDGSEVAVPAIVNEDGRDIYVIKYASELAWLAAAVNGTLTEDYTRAGVDANDFKGKTFRLTQDIDLGGKEWTPIGDSNHIFKGTFDGNDKVVKNLVITGYNSNVGLFGVTHDGEIKNFIVENAKVSGRLNVGVVAGQPYTSKYTNITVKGHVEVNGMAYVGGVGGKNAYADWTDVKVEADATSYVKANSVENGTAYRTYVGGVVGFNGEGGHKFSNITSNINVEGSTCDVGGLFGIAHYGNQFENCVCTGNVTITTDEAENAIEMGGIAGVWHNETGYSVTMTGCSFTGTLNTPNIDKGDDFFYYGGLVGAPYSATGKGKLIIGGKQYVASAAQLQAAIDAAEGETTLYLGYGIVGDVTVVQKQGVKVTIDGENQKYNGSIKVHSNSNYYADAALTIKNVNFETSTASVNFIEALENGSERYSSNITVEDCTFTATGEAVKTAVGVQVKATRGVTVTRCTATNMHSLIQAQSCDTGDVKVVDSTVNGKNGVAFKQVKSATVEGTTITALEYGIRFDGNIDNYGIVVKNNNVTAVQPLIVRKMTGKNNTIALEGTNALTTEAEYQIVITKGSDDEAYVKPTGTYTLTGAEGYTIFPAAFPVATWDEFTAALAAGEDWIKLTENIAYEGSSSYNLKKDVVVELNGKTFTTGNASTTWLNIMGSKATFKDGIIEGKVYVQKNGATYSNATFENVTFGGTITFSSVTQGSLAVQGGNSVYAKKCTFKGKGSSTPNVVSLEGTSSGSVIFEDCTFNSSMNRFYANPIGGTAVFKLINCSFNKAAIVETSANWDFVNNMTITGCKYTLYLSEVVKLYIAKTAANLTDAEKACLNDYKKNNNNKNCTVYCAGVKY